MIHEILNELNLENGSNYKLKVLKKYQNNDLLKRVCEMTYDRVRFTYGMSLKNIDKFNETYIGSGELDISLEEALNELQNQIVSRKLTGHSALAYVCELMMCLPYEDCLILRKIINRDLKINVGRTNINKVWKDLITKPVYMRCDVYSQKTAKNIQYPAYIQLKADGTYRDFTVDGGSVSCVSRSGEEYEYPSIFNDMQDYKDGHYHGELTVVLDDILFEKIKIDLEKLDQKNGTTTVQEITDAYNKHKAECKEYILPRAIGNGLINSDDVPHDNLKLELWHYVTFEEYDIARKKDRKNPNTKKYQDSFNELQEIVKGSKRVHVIPYVIVNNKQEALQQVGKWMADDLEGGVLKSFDMVFKDGTSKEQLKLKLCIDAEMRIIGFKDGTPGTKREGKVGSVLFANDEGTIKGSCSGFSDDILDDMTNNPEKYSNKVFTVQFNNLTKSRTNTFYALSHPRYIELRNDKDETDTLEKVQALIQMAMELA